MDIFSSSDVTHLPQSVLNVVSRNGLSYESTAGGTPYVDFDLASSIGFYLASDLMLSFNMTYKSDVVYNLRPQCNMGINGLIRQINVYSISDGVLLEEVQDNHVLGAALMSHNNGSDKEMKDGNYKKWSLTESYCGENDAQDITPFTAPNALPVSPTTPNPASPAYQTQQIQLPLRLSHLLGSEQVIPISALGGLRIRLILNPPEVFNCLHADDMDGNVMTSTTTVITTDKWSVPAGTLGTYPPPLVFVTPDATPLVPGTPAGCGGSIVYNGSAVTPVPPAAGYADSLAICVAINAVLDALTAAPGDVVAAPGAGTGDITLRNVDGSGTGAADFTGSSLFDVDMSDAVSYDLQAANAGSMVVASAATTPDIRYASKNVDLVVGGGATTYLADAALLIALNAHFDALTTTGGVLAASNITGTTATGWKVDIDNASAIGDIKVDTTSTLWNATSLLDISTITPALGAGDVFTVGVTYTVDIIPDAHSSALSTLNLANSTLYLNNGKDINTCPFKVGQPIVIKLDGVGYSNVSPAIASIEPSGLVNGIKLVWATPWDVGGLVTGSKNVKSSLPDFGQINYSLTQMSMNVPVITPPPSYIVALQQAINSDEGMSMDVRAYAIQRSSVIQGQTMAAMNLNGLVAHKAKGILSIPYLVNTGSFDTVFAGDNLTMLNGTKYWYEYSGVKHPSRGINTDQTRQGSLSQEQMDQMIKSYEYCLDTSVKNLDGFKDSYKHKTFFYGRNLGIFNSVYDAVAGNIQFVIEATNSAAGGAEETYNINHYCSAIYNIVMRPDGVVLLK